MRAAELSRPQAIRFEVRAAERLLLIEGAPAKLGARAFDVLQALYERRDRVVTKNELFEIVWPGVVVEENNLQVQISTLRKLLGPSTIATIPGRGYRFTGVSADASSPRIDAAPPARSAPVASALTNLPRELAPLYGRQAESATLHDLLAAHRMVTIVGASGIGKTATAAGKAPPAGDT